MLSSFLSSLLPDHCVCNIHFISHTWFTWPLFLLAQQKINGDRLTSLYFFELCYFHDAGIQAREGNRAMGISTSVKHGKVEN